VAHSGRRGPGLAAARGAALVFWLRHLGPDLEIVPIIVPAASFERLSEDRALLRGPLAGPVGAEKLEQLYARFVNPDRPDDYRLTWCGRFAVPMGLLLLERKSAGLGARAPLGHPVAYATSVGSPELPVREVGLGPTAPANLYHFVGYPAAAYTVP
jgi:hypothetical protein